MESIVTYKKPGIETTYESTSRLSKRQILFVIILPLVFLIGALLGNGVIAVLGPFVSTNQLLSTMIGFLSGIVVCFLLIPFVFKMPNGKTTLGRYLNDIGVDHIRPVFRTILIYFPCLLSIILAQIVASFVYNHFILHWNFDLFLNYLFDSSRIAAWIGLNPIIALGSIFEEIVLRGVVLTMLLQAYSERKAIAGSAIAFGYVHILNLLNGSLTYESLVFVAGQIVWATIIGVLYGYMFLKTGNLYANMLLHWTANGLNNCFMYLPYVTSELHALLNILFNIGLMSTVISILWVAVVNKYWPLTSQKQRIQKPSRNWEFSRLIKELHVFWWKKFGPTA